LSFSDAVQPLKDILASIGQVEVFTAGFDFEAFRADLKTIAAVERKLQVISEAATRLGPAADTLCPGPPWREIRGIGNWLRHGYDRLDLETIWHTATVDLPSLKSAVISALAGLDDPASAPSP
jgi:uncharacterized protein with HEPN domain